MIYFLGSSCNFFKFHQSVNSLFHVINTKQIKNCNWIFVSINSRVFLQILTQVEFATSFLPNMQLINLNVDKVIVG